MTKLINTHEQWGTLIVEHRDRLTRVGFEYFPLFLENLDKNLIVADQSSDNEEGAYQDIFSILYSFAASEYGKRGAKNRAQKAMDKLDSGDEE